MILSSQKIYFENCICVAVQLCIQAVICIVSSTNANIFLTTTAGAKAHATTYIGQKSEKRCRTVCLKG